MRAFTRMRPVFTSRKIDHTLLLWLHWERFMYFKAIFIFTENIKQPILARNSELIMYS